MTFCVNQEAGRVQTLPFMPCDTHSEEVDTTRGTGFRYSPTFAACDESYQVDCQCQFHNALTEHDQHAVWQVSAQRGTLSGKLARSS